MATKIQVGLSTYLIDFANGQASFRSPPYTQYSTDHDTNYITLRTTINQMIDEINAIQGPNAGLGVDILVFNDPERASSGEPNDAAGANLTGFVGLHSFEPNIATTSTANDSVHLDNGQIVVGGTAVRNSVGATFVGSGGAGTRFFAIDLAGALYQEVAAGQRAADLFSINWNGTAFTGAFTRRQQVFFDGDEYEAMRQRTATGHASGPTTFSLFRYEAFRFRLEAIERILAGFDTDSLAGALGQPALRLGTQSIPGLAFHGDPNTGMFSPGADQVALTTNAVNRLAVSTTAITLALVLLGVAGTAGAPSYAFSGEPDCGMYTPGTNQVGLSTAGTERVLLDAEGNVDLPTNSRVKGERTAVLSVADNTATLISFTAADQYDVGTWHNNGGGSPGDQEFTVPSGATGLYAIKLFTEWAAPTQVTDFTIEVTVNGTALVEKIQARLPASGDAAFSLSISRILNAADVVRARVTQNDTVGAASLDLQAATLSIDKIA